MTNVVRGAGRAKYNARKKKHDQSNPIVGGKRDDALKAAAKPAPKAAKPTGTWDGEKSLGANVDALKTAGLTWRGIQELAAANGHDVPWPDGGKLLRARKQFLAGTEGAPKQQVRRTGAAARKKAAAEDDRPYVEQAQDRVERAMQVRHVPWDDETPDEDVLKVLDGKRITFVSSITGYEQQVRIVRGSKHNKIEYGQNGRYIDFISEDGPFMAVSLSRIISVK